MKFGGRRRKGNRGSKPSGEGVGPGHGRGRERARGDEKRSSLKHEVALLVGAGGEEEEIRAPRLKEECGGDPDHPHARKAIAASRAGRLRCPVCGSVVERVFPSPESSVERWHFRRRRGEGECDHEGETVAHREAKQALAAALGEVLGPEGWEVFEEKRLENGRRPDVLAEHAGGARVAFEVQYADISRSGWRKRQRDYDALGVPVYWFLGAEKRYGRRRDDLRSALEEEAGQRVIFVGRFADAGGNLGGIEAREISLSYLDPAAPPELEGYRVLAPPADLASLAPERRRALKVTKRGNSPSFSLRKLGLRLLPGTASSPGAVLRSPLDAWNEKREREGVRRGRERLAREAAQRERSARAEEEARRVREAVLAGWEEEEAAWLASAEREEAEALLGVPLVEDLENEDLQARVYGETVRRGASRTGGWRVGFFLREVEPLGGERPFVWSEAVTGYLASRDFGAERAPGPDHPAWRELRKDLVRSGLLRPHGSPGEDRWAARGTAPAAPKSREEPPRRPDAASPASRPPGRLRRLLGRFFS